MTCFVRSLFFKLACLIYISYRIGEINAKAKGKDKLFCYAIDIESNKNDVLDAKKVAEELDVNLEVINLTKTYKSYLQVLGGKNLSKLTKSNLKVRMRMVALFAYAQEHSGLVLGTDNMDERYVGYFTKYGDGAADVLPIVYFVERFVCFLLPNQLLVFQVI